MRLVYYTAMHGRQQTVKLCLEYTLAVREQLAQEGIELELIYGYTDQHDANFLSGYPVHAYQAPNSPLWKKFHGGMELLAGMDYDAVCMFGSDDIADVAYYRAMAELCRQYDYIGFTDIYFHDRVSKRSYYWPGYGVYRKGEPSGAGKCYSRDVMERIDHKIFQPSVGKGIDMGCDLLMKSIGVHAYLLSVKDGYLLCDIKDGQGITPLSRFGNLGRVELGLFGG